LTVTRDIVITTDCDTKNFVALPASVTSLHEIIYGQTKTLTVSKKLENDAQGTSWSTICGDGVIEVIHDSPTAVWTTISGTDSD
jgi:hypothetical protein